MSDAERRTSPQERAGTALVAGGVAGTTVDVTLFPLDTVKTRLQSEVGFWRAGGFTRIYAGIGPTLLGSAPNAAIFFCTYEMAKNTLTCSTSMPLTAVHMTSASLGEVAACVVRVPVEIVKQRRQANARGLSSFALVRLVLRTEGVIGLYRGFWTTVSREVPFSLIQFPLWEYFKVTWSQRRKNGQSLSPIQSAACGSVAGGISAGFTTPLDVAKTRIMLAASGSDMAQKASVVYALTQVRKESGVRGWFAGLVPRVTWISLGGAVFFGTYEVSKQLCSSFFNE